MVVQIIGSRRQPLRYRRDTDLRKPIDQMPGEAGAGGIPVAEDRDVAAAKQVEGRILETSVRADEPDGGHAKFVG